MTEQFTPGMRVEIRDAEWRIRQLDRTSNGDYLLTCDGPSELVRGREGRFLPALETTGWRTSSASLRITRNGSRIQMTEQQPYFQVVAAFTGEVIA